MWKQQCHSKGECHGTDGQDFLRGTPGDDEVYGKRADDNLDLRAGDDFGDGQAGDDRLLGFDGADWLHGSEGADILYGEDGPDRLYGDAGQDVMRGGPDDQLHAYGAAVDDLHCGPGRDRAFVGKFDHVDRDSCEIVRTISGKYHPRGFPIWGNPWVPSLK